MIKTLGVIMALTLTGEAKVTLEGIGPIRIQFVPASHWALTDGASAKALRTEDGHQWILVNVDQDIAELDLVILHEAAHLAAWDRYGEGIDEHGPEFRAICRQIVPRKQKQYCGDQNGRN